MESSWSKISILALHFIFFKRHLSQLGPLLCLFEFEPVDAVEEMVELLVEREVMDIVVVVALPSSLPIEARAWFWYSKEEMQFCEEETMALTGIVGGGVIVAMPIAYLFTSIVADFSLLARNIELFAKLGASSSDEGARFLVQMADESSGSVMPTFWAPPRHKSFSNKETLGNNRGGRDRSLFLTVMLVDMFLSVHDDPTNVAVYFFSYNIPYAAYAQIFP